MKNLFLTLICFAGWQLAMGQCPIPGYNCLSQSDIEEMLSEHVMAQGLIKTYDDSNYPPVDINCEPNWDPKKCSDNDEAYELIGRLKPKLISGATGLWGAYWSISQQGNHYEVAGLGVNRIKQLAGDEVVVATFIGEHIDNKDALRQGFTSIQIEAEDYLAFGQTPPAQVEYFEFNNMRYTNGLYLNEYGSDTAVPDISRQQTKYFFYQRARKYIDQGIEAIHFGQIHLMDNNDPGHHHWYELIQAIRNYAKDKNRGFVVISGPNKMWYTPNISILNAWTAVHPLPKMMNTTEGYNERFDDINNFLDECSEPEERILLLDYHVQALRLKEYCGDDAVGDLDAVPEIGYADAIYTKSGGGINPNGWFTEHNPYSVEFDNTGISCKFGRSNLEMCHTNNNNDWDNWEEYWYIWGYEEIAWFAVQTEGFRNGWLRFMNNWLKCNDPNGFLQMSAYRGFLYGVGEECECETGNSDDNVGGTPHRDCQYENFRGTYLASDRQFYPDGWNQELAIQEIWKSRDLWNYEQVRTIPVQNISAQASMFWRETDRQLYYVNSTNEISLYYWANKKWNHKNIAMPANVRGGLAWSEDRLELFYVTTSGTINSINYIGSGQWNHNAINPNPTPVSNVVGDLIWNGNGTLYFQTANGKLDHIWTWPGYNGWDHYAFPSSFPANAAGERMIWSKNRGELFYVTTTGSINSISKDASGTWQHQAIVPQSGPITGVTGGLAWSESREELFFQKTNGQVDHIWTWPGFNGWSHYSFPSSFPLNASGGKLAWSESRSALFYKTNDDRIYHYWWNGNSWEERIMNEFAPANVSTDEMVWDETMQSLFYTTNTREIHRIWWWNCSQGAAFMRAPSDVLGQLTEQLKKEEVTINDKPGLVVSPNPFQSSINIGFQTIPKNNGVLKIFNLNGALVKTLEYAAGTKKLSLELDHIPSGSILLIQTFINDQMLHSKLIKQ